MQIFKQATLFFSAETPNLLKVIPAMDWIDKHLASSSLDPVYLPSIKASMLIRKRLLNKYYNFTDHSEVYRIAMGMFIHTKPSEVIDLALQSSTPSASLSISDLRDGKKTGSTQHARLLRPNLTEPIAIFTATRTRRVVHRCWYVTDALFLSCETHVCLGRGLRIRQHFRKPLFMLKFGPSQSRSTERA